MKTSRRKLPSEMRVSSAQISWSREEGLVKAGRVIRCFSSFNCQSTNRKGVISSSQQRGHVTSKLLTDFHCYWHSFRDAPVCVSKAWSDAIKRLEKQSVCMNVKKAMVRSLTNVNSLPSKASQLLRPLYGDGQLNPAAQVAAKIQLCALSGA